MECGVETKLTYLLELSEEEILWLTKVISEHRERFAGEAEFSRKKSEELLRLLKQQVGE